jgi:hypothetical protein
VRHGVYRSSARPEYGPKSTKCQTSRSRAKLTPTGARTGRIRRRAGMGVFAAARRKRPDSWQQRSWRWKFSKKVTFKGKQAELEQTKGEAQWTRWRRIEKVALSIGTIARVIRTGGKAPRGIMKLLQRWQRRAPPSCAWALRGGVVWIATNGRGMECSNVRRIILARIPTDASPARVDRESERKWARGRIHSTPGTF